MSLNKNEEFMDNPNSKKIDVLNNKQSDLAIIPGIAINVYRDVKNYFYIDISSAKLLGLIDFETFKFLLEFNSRYYQITKETLEGLKEKYNIDFKYIYIDDVYSNKSFEKTEKETAINKLPNNYYLDKPPIEFDYETKEKSNNSLAKSEEVFTGKYVIADTDYYDPISGEPIIFEGEIVDSEFLRRAKREFTTSPKYYSNDKNEKTNIDDGNMTLNSDNMKERDPFKLDTPLKGRFVLDDLGRTTQVIEPPNPSISNKFIPNVDSPNNINDGFKNELKNVEEDEFENQDSHQLRDTLKSIRDILNNKVGEDVYTENHKKL